MRKLALKYEYRNLPIPGGGYVTGFLYHKKVPNILYMRTDIGGTYRFEYEEHRWKSLINHVTMFDLSETFPIAMALDENEPNMLYIACGVNDDGRSGILCISDDYGKTFRYETMPCWIHGNMNGRGTGSRLLVDSCDGNTLYFASQRNGLYITHDQGKNWVNHDICGENYLTMVWVSPVNGAIVVGTAGVTTSTDHVRGTTLYVSYNQGESFEIMPQPKSHNVINSRMSGYVAQRYDYDGKYLYVTLSNTGARSYVVEEGYSCDSGDVLAGRVIRYSFDQNGKIDNYTDITPNEMIEFDKDSDYDFGFSGIATSMQEPGLVVCSTICKDNGDMIFMSKDYGKTWEVILYELEIGRLNFNTSYMKPEYNGDISIIHWISDLKINPFNKNELWFNTGVGAFVTNNLLQEDREFHDYCDGLEETVHLNLYSPPSGDALLIDMVGDLGGFSFEKTDEPCENTYTDAHNNRYITCINADYTDDSPETLVVTARGNWKGKTKGGLILSKDQGHTFTRLKMPFGLSDKIDAQCRQIENPNTNAGWVAIGADAKTIVWCIADGIFLPVDLIVVSHDQGKTFHLVKIFNLENNAVTSGRMKVYADRVNPQIFYGFGEDSQIYVSKDGGDNFYQYRIKSDFPLVEFGFIDCANKTEIRGNAGYEGEFYLALSTKGLWKMKYDCVKDKVMLNEITQPGEFAYCVGLGIRKGKKYLGGKKAIYICGVIDDDYGFFKSEDEGKTWYKLNTEMQMFGDINSIEGDSRIPGRYYIATGSLGVLYGEPEKKL